MVKQGWNLIRQECPYDNYTTPTTNLHPKRVSHQGFCLTSRNRKNVPTSLGRVIPNAAAVGNQTRRLASHQAAMQTQADWNSVFPQKNPGVRTAPAGPFESLGGSLSTSHPQIPSPQLLELQNLLLTPSS